MASSSLEAFSPVLKYLQAHLLLPYRVSENGKIIYSSWKRKVFSAANALYIVSFSGLFFYRIVMFAKGWKSYSAGEMKGQVIAIIYMLLLFLIFITIMKISRRLKLLLNKFIYVLDMCGEFSRTDCSKQQQKLSRIIWIFSCMKIALFVFSFWNYTEFKLGKMMYGVELFLGSFLQSMLHALEELAFIIAVEVIPVIRNILSLVKGLESQNAKRQSSTLKYCRQRYIELHNVTKKHYMRELAIFHTMAVFENAFNIIFMGIITFYFQSQIGTRIQLSLLLSIFPPALHLSLMCWAGTMIQSEV